MACGMPKLQTMLSKNSFTVAGVDNSPSLMKQGTSLTSFINMSTIVNMVLQPLSNGKPTMQSRDHMKKWEPGMGNGANRPYGRLVLSFAC